MGHETLEYPYAAPLGQPGRDTIKILEDTNGDGVYDKLFTFADGLNIPTGIYPYKDGAIAWSIPKSGFCATPTVTAERTSARNLRPARLRA
ncbi:MAG: hypothetical protein CM1200mP29_08220 [Verrucomicrobiota bacterium]|nr:MAG: hypothetical protein CM1200mP29_08220 [Verrucomicrobiota bacterium]